jgi:hypothetical protein
MAPVTTRPKRVRYPEYKAWCNCWRYCKGESKLVSAGTFRKHRDYREFGQFGSPPGPSRTLNSTAPTQPAVSHRFEDTSKDPNDPENWEWDESDYDEHGNGGGYDRDDEPAKSQDHIQHIDAACYTGGRDDPSDGPDRQELHGCDQHKSDVTVSLLDMSVVFCI